MIEFQNVTKLFRNTVALNSVTFTIRDRETTLLIGPSGSGKSTLLRLIIGLVYPDQGSVTVDGGPVLPSTVLLMRRKMGYVIQEGGLFPHLTSRQNITLMARHLKWDKGRIDSRVTTLAQIARFPLERLDRYPAELSGGQRRRVSLMRALMLDPDILLLDEPLGALDPMIRADLQTDLKEIFTSLGKTVVLVTHDLNEAAFFDGHVVLMNEGQISQMGSIYDLVNSPASAFVTRFLSAQRIFFAGPIPT